MFMDQTIFEMKKLVIMGTLIVLLIPTKITQAITFPKEFQLPVKSEFSKCIWRCNVHECFHFIWKHKTREFASCLATCVEKNCAPIFDPKHSSNSLYACTIGCTKSTLQEYSTYGNYYFIT